MKHIRLPLLLLFLLLLIYSPAVLAAAPYVTLVANGRAQYRFDYRGDRTPIEIALDAPGADNVELLVYTPTPGSRAPQPYAMPIGRGTPNRNHDLFWAGNFNAPGIYYAVVVNPSPGPILYHLDIHGGSVSGFGQILADAPPADSAFSIQNGSARLTVNLPPGAGLSQLHLTVPNAPASCTHANQIPTTLTTSIKLCPNEIYPPLHLVGNYLALYSDDSHSAIVNSAGRQFAVTIDGAHDLVEGATIQASAEASDAGAWLCQYAECLFPTSPIPTTLHGGILYGGGILLRGSYSTIHAVTVRGGTIGIATVNGVANNIIENQLNDLNGWGVFNLYSASSYFVGNTFNRENHGCTTPDGFKFKHGCETAGWVCLACASNVIARNHCESSANCFYMSGERGLASNNNRLIANYCAGATDNCFEITFARGNILQDNITTADPNTGQDCNYPFWIGGSTVYLENNLWQCAVSVDDALALAQASTSATTLARDLDAFVPTTSADDNQPSATVEPAPSHGGRLLRE